MPTPFERKICAVLCQPSEQRCKSCGNWAELWVRCASVIHRAIHRAGWQTLSWTSLAPANAALQQCKCIAIWKNTLMGQNGSNEIHLGVSFQFEVTLYQDLYAAFKGQLSKGDLRKVGLHFSTRYKSPALSIQVRPGSAGNVSRCGVGKGLFPRMTWEFHPGNATPTPLQRPWLWAHDGVFGLLLQAGSLLQGAGKWLVN